MGEPWPEKPSADYVRERVCTLVSDVWNNNFTSEKANDCFCKAGGFWESSSYDGTYENGFRHDGEAVMWLEQAAKAMQGIPAPAKFVEAFDVMLLELTKWPCDRASSGIEDECVEVLPFDEFCSRCRAIAMALAAKPTDPPKEAK